jgi:hypothetical protein
MMSYFDVVRLQPSLSPVIDDQPVRKCKSGSRFALARIIL